MIENQAPGETMDFAQYQLESGHTDRIDASAALEVHLLGLAGEAGSVASEYKKWLRDGRAHLRWQEHMKEELGDVLWYLTAIASDLGLDLDDVARANLAKTQSRWGTSQPELGPLDIGWPEDERLPRHGTYRFQSTMAGAGTESQRAGVEVWFEDRKIGNQLTDASRVDDGYRYHDIFHLSYAVLLGWSPVTRKIAERKRRSDPVVDENEDGGRAIAIEEGIAALAFAYGAQHGYLADIAHVDERLLDTVMMLAENTEARVRTAADWERAILAGFAAFRSLLEHGSAEVEFDADAGTLVVRPC